MYVIAQIHVCTYVTFDTFCSGGGEGGGPRLLTLQDHQRNNARQSR